MKNRTKLLSVVMALALLGASVAYAASSLATIQTTIDVTDPLAKVNSVSLDGSPCSLSGTVYACSGSVAEGSSNSIIVSLTNPGGASVTVQSTTSVPSACGISATDQSVSVPAQSTVNLTIGLSVSATAPISGCSLGTGLVQE